MFVLCSALSHLLWGLKAWRYKDVAEQKKISEFEYTGCGMSQGQSSEAGQVTVTSPSHCGSAGLVELGFHSEPSVLQESLQMQMTAGSHGVSWEPLKTFPFGMTH